jgi:crotonobetainyl-CoA:carnitine CoA-transferase CaiB-like acyl-CoA transferase
MSEPGNLLSHLRVLDVSSYIAAPAAGTIMGDFGADVIKIEPLVTGDPYRAFQDAPGNPHSETAYGWQMDNRNKRSLALDLASSAGLETFHRIVRSADVVIVNTPLKSRAKLSLTYEDLRILNPRVIYASLTAYGEVGPEADRSGFDHTALWARTGMMDTIRPAPDAPPSRSALGMGDHASGMTLFAAIMMALYRRELTGEGASVKTNLMANGLWCNSVQVQAMLCGAEYAYRPARENADNALHNLYKTADDRWFHLIVIPEEKRWPALLQVIDRNDLLTNTCFNTTAKRHSNSPELIKILDAAFLQKDMAHWQEKLDSAEIPFGAVYRLRDIPDDVQMNESDALTKLSGLDGHVDRTVNSPLWIENSPKKPANRAPELGEHSHEVLTEFGFTEDEIEHLVQEGIVQS